MSSNLDMLPPFVGPYMRIDRANAHFQILKSEILEFLGREPYRVLPETDPETDYELFRIKVIEAIPNTWAVLIGDIFHNLRSALDNLAIDLLRLHTQDPSKTAIDETYSPIGKTKTTFDKALQEKFKRVHPTALKIVKRLKPYQGGIDAFWTIHRLNILDKHVCLLPCAVTRKKTIVTFSRFVDEGDGSFAAYLNSMKEGGKVEFAGSSGLKDGDIIGSALKIEAVSPNALGGVDRARPTDQTIEFTLDIAFGKGQVIDGEPVIPAIEKIIDFTKRVIGIFERNLHC